MMIVGAPKCGTTSLLRYLGCHPGIEEARETELTWFSDPVLAAGPFPTTRYFGPGPARGLRLGKLAGLMYRPVAVARLVALNPAVTALVVLRDPVARAYSDYWFDRRRGREPQGEFRAALEAAAPGPASRRSLLEAGEYDRWVGALVAALGRERVAVFVLEELAADPAGVAGPVVARLGLDPALLGPALPRENPRRAARSVRLAQARRNGGAVGLARRMLPAGARRRLRAQYRRLNEVEDRFPDLDPALAAELAERYRPSVARLEALLGRGPIEAWHHGQG